MRAESVDSSPKIVSVSTADQWQLSACNSVEPNSGPCFRALKLKGSNAYNVDTPSRLTMNSEESRLKLELLIRCASTARPSRESVTRAIFRSDFDSIKTLPDSVSTALEPRPTLAGDVEILAMALCWTSSSAMTVQTTN